MLALECRADGMLVNLLDRINGDDADDRGAGARGFGDDAFDELRLDEGTHGVMDRHQIGIGGEDGERILDRDLARIAAFGETHRLRWTQIVDEFPHPGDVVGA